MALPLDVMCIHNIVSCPPPPGFIYLPTLMSVKLCNQAPKELLGSWDLMSTGRGQEAPPGHQVWELGFAGHLLRELRHISTPSLNLGCPVNDGRWGGWCHRNSRPGDAEELKAFCELMGVVAGAAVPEPFLLVAALQEILILCHLPDRDRRETNGQFTPARAAGQGWTQSEGCPLVSITQMIRRRLSMTATDSPFPEFITFSFPAGVPNWNVK